jgi:hypothetical protein
VIGRRARGRHTARAAEPKRFILVKGVAKDGASCFLHQFRGHDPFRQLDAHAREGDEVTLQSTLLRHVGYPQRLPVYGIAIHVRGVVENVDRLAIVQQLPMNARALHGPQVLQPSNLVPVDGRLETLSEEPLLPDRKATIIVETISNV